MAFSFKNVLSSLGQKTSGTPTKVVGIDFGASSVKVVEVEQREDALALTSYGELQLGPYAEMEMGKPTQLEQPKKIEALVDVLRESNIEAKSGVLALPLSFSFVTVIKLKADANEDIGSRVRVEARKYIPVPITDVTLDWTEISSHQDNDNGQREVLVAAIQNDAFANMNELMRAVNMASQPSEIELFSSIRAVTKTTDEAVAIIDLGARTSKMYLSEKGMLRKIHRAHAGGTHATEKIASVMDVSFSEAENFKRNYQENSEHATDIKKAFVTSFERAFQEFKRVLEQHEMQSGTKVTRIVLCGGSASFVDMPNFASYMFDREVKRANPFTKVAFPAFMEDTLAEIAPTFAVALGSALRPFEVS